MQNRKKKDTDLQNSLLESVGEGEGGKFQENSIKTCILSRVKQITSPGWMHETSARTWCTGKTQRERWRGRWEGGIGMGNTCKPMAVSFQCMTKSTTNKKKILNNSKVNYTIRKQNFSSKVMLCLKKDLVYLYLTSQQTINILNNKIKKRLAIFYQLLYKSENCNSDYYKRQSQKLQGFSSVYLFTTAIILFEV